MISFLTSLLNEMVRLTCFSILLRSLKKGKLLKAVNMVHNKADDVVKDAYIQYRNVVDDIAKAMSSDNPIRQLILIDDELSHAMQEESL